MLQRIHGTAFFKKDDHDAHLFQPEDAKKSDHRQLGKQLDLTIQHPCPPGTVLRAKRRTTPTPWTGAVAPDQPGFLFLQFGNAMRIANMPIPNDTLLKQAAPAHLSQLPAQP